MLLSAAHIESIVLPTMAVKVCHADSTPWKTMNGDEIRVLAQRGLITGRGSLTRMKCVILTVPADTADTIVEHAIRAAQIRGRLAATQASQTCIGEKWIGLKGIPAMVYKHVRTSVFAPAARAEYV